MVDDVIHNLNLNLHNIESLKTVQIDSEIMVSVNFGKLISIHHLDKSVIVITFSNGELRLDLSSEEIRDNTFPKSAVIQENLDLNEIC